MMVGALLDLGLVSGERLQAELSKLNIDHEFDIEITKASKNAIFATDFDVHLKHQNDHDHNHHREHDHEHNCELGHENHKTEQLSEHHHHDHHHGRSMADIEKMIKTSTLTVKAIDTALSIFSHIAHAEAVVHNKPVSEIHFHEVGAVDSIVDIVSVAILLDWLEIDRVLCSVINEGHGFVDCQHGLMPIPVPAVSQMFAMCQVPVNEVDIESELVTPTGAGIVCALVEKFGPKPMMKQVHIGYGSGKKEFKTPNLLRVYYGEIENKEQSMLMIESNIDNMTGEDLGYLQEKLFKGGAADVFYTSIYMKKNRPAVKVSVLCSENLFSQISDILFANSSTIGLRYYSVGRNILGRKTEKVMTKYGVVSVKISGEGSVLKISPEYEDLRVIALRENLSLSFLRDEVMKAYKEQKS